MARISVFLNPHASKGNSLFPRRDIEHFFRKHELAIHSPKNINELNETIENEITKGVEYIFSVGGDGTANTISQNLIGKNVKLMIMPAGTANDLANEAGIPKNIKSISEIFNDEKNSKLIDAIKINHRYMITNGGIGLASDVANIVNSLRKKSKIFKYLMKIMGKEIYSLVFAYQMLLRPYRKRPFFIESPDFPLLDPRVSSPLILINNQKFLGGKFKVAPFTNNNDGKFNVTIFLHTKRMGLLKTSLKMMHGKYPIQGQELISFETDQLVINSLDNAPMEFFGDGENFPPSQIMNISITPNALELCSSQI